MKRLCALVALLAIAISGVAVAAGGKAKKDSGVAYVTATHTEGKDLYVSGDITDKILGHGAIVYVTRVSTGAEPGEIKITAKKVTIYTEKGTLTGTGSGVQVNTTGADGTVTATNVKDGEFNLTKGTGALKGHSLKGTFAGPYADGLYTFNYKATYK
jgi:hypothetical protein